jgi:inner membrane protein
MASLGHIAVGIAAARIDGHATPPRWSSMVVWSALSLLPDADVVGFALGVRYGDPWGHRGATHSLALAVAVGLAVGLAAGRLKRPAARTALLAVAVLASHGLLDTMTDGGLGCALLWPFDLTRYFAPWRPIPVAPIGMAFVSPGGASVALTELVLFSPALLFALRPRRSAAPGRAAAALLAVWLVSCWLMVSADPFRDGVVGLVLRDDTVYASGFSEARFRAIAPGASDQDVRSLVGAPLGESWLYAPKGQPFAPAAERSAAAPSDECLAVRLQSGVVSSASAREACTSLGIIDGLSSVDVGRRLGAPPESCWQYSRSGSRQHYRLRAVCFRANRVETIVRRWD